MMAKLPIRGGSSSSPVQGEAQFRRVVLELTRNSASVEEILGDLYLRIGQIVDQWLAQEGRVDVSPVANGLTTVHKNLQEVDKILSGHDFGLRHAEEIEIVSQLKAYLARDRSIGSLEAAQKLITSFREDAARIAHLSLVAAAEITNLRSSKGRPRLDWYDDFTAVLLDLAKKADITPDLRKDRINGVQSGWLLDAALALEPFLFPGMGSDTLAACFKRLERSKTRLTSRRTTK
jgi:hypothetical protein